MASPVSVFRDSFGSTEYLVRRSLEDDYAGARLGGREFVHALV